jgi:hypothetical protein
MHEGDALGPSQNKLQDRLIRVDFLNLVCEGLLLVMHAGGTAPKDPSTTLRTNLHPNLTSGTYGIIKHDELRTY